MTPPPEEAAPVPLDEKALTNVATNLGRILLIFGGAYLLRAQIAVARLLRRDRASTAPS